MSIKTKLLTSVATLSLIGGAAFAQGNTQPTEKSATEMSEYAPGWNEDLDQTYGAIADTRVAELIGMNVVTEGDEDVGEVDNFVIMEDQIQAVVGVGGFLGLGEHDVALPLSELTYDGEKLVISYTKEDLEAMPEYTEELDQTAFAEDDTFRTRTVIQGDGTQMAEGDTEAATDEDSTAMDMADGTLESDVDEADAPSGEDVAAAEETAGGEDTMTEEVAEAEKGQVEQEAEELAAEADAAATEAGKAVERTAEAAGDAVEEGTEEVAEATDATGEAIEEGAAGAAQMTENAAESTGDAVEEGMEEVAEAADATGDAVEKGAEEVAEAGSDAAKAAGLWAEHIEGKLAEIADAPVSEITSFKVATAEGETIGDIEALARHNDKVVALVGVGGFLGLGEHDVALDLTELSFDGEKFIATGYTEEDLKAMPEYDEASVERLEGDVTLRSTY